MKKIERYGPGILDRGPRIREFGPGPEVEREPVYERVEDYDPVLKAHCRIPEKVCLFPAAAPRGGKGRVV